jgi:hypothetical protein
VSVQFYFEWGLNTWAAFEVGPIAVRKQQQLNNFQNQNARPTSTSRLQGYLYTQWGHGSYQTQFSHFLIGLSLNYLQCKSFDRKNTLFKYV